ncbi:MAG: hypothetical protein KBD76_15895 [Bacteriovorax sp.]|nr:hypothetical protein [Bacteriovorax sp.]
MKIYKRSLPTKQLDDAVFYVRSPLYHQAALEESFRYDLEGEKFEEIIDSDKEFSKKKIEKINKKQSISNQEDSD